MKYCQGNKCHEYKTKDRIRGTKGEKYYSTRRRSSFYYSDNFCSMNCQNDWLIKNIEHALNHFGRTTEPKKVLCDQAWYKDYKYNYNNGNDSNYNHYLINDLLGQRIPITEQQYNDDNIITPNNLSQ
jgi:hypothetical protein